MRSAAAIEESTISARSRALEIATRLFFASPNVMRSRAQAFDVRAPDARCGAARPCSSAREAQLVPPRRRRPRARRPLRRRFGESPGLERVGALTSCARAPSPASPVCAENGLHLPRRRARSARAPRRARAVPWSGASNAWALDWERREMAAPRDGAAAAVNGAAVGERGGDGGEHGGVVRAAKTIS